MRYRKIGILGGTGFVGRHLCCELSRRRCEVRVITRHRVRHRDLLVFPTVEMVAGDIHSASSLSELLAGCDAVINLVGILNEGPGPGETFDEAHAALPAKVVEACGYGGITRLLHMSALNADAAAPSRYLRTKAAGEKAAHAGAEHGLAVTSFRPSVIFGAGDSFLNRFATLLALTPIAFPLACPGATFAPVWVEDVVRAFVVALEERATAGRHYELCGPRTYKLRELVEYTGRVTGHQRWLIGLGDMFSVLQARVLERVPGKPFSYDNYLSLQVASVCHENGFEALGIVPTGMEAVVPGYLGREDRPSRYSALRTDARRS